MRPKAGQRQMSNCESYIVHGIYEGGGGGGGGGAIIT